MHEPTAPLPPALFAGPAQLARRGFLTGQWAARGCGVRAEGGRLSFRPDIYGWDRRLAAALTRGD